MASLTDNSALLGQSIADAIEGLTLAGHPDPSSVVWKKVAELLLQYIKDNAIVSPAGLPTPMSNSGGPVAGTGKIL